MTIKTRIPLPEASRAMIPKIVHQVWHQISKTSDIPDELLVSQQTWQTHHPGWDYRLWGDADSRNFLERHYPDFVAIYDSYPTPISGWTPSVISCSSITEVSMRISISSCCDHSGRCSTETRLWSGWSPHPMCFSTARHRAVCVRSLVMH